ncbi:MAG: haloacid dehalogenase type II [Gemmatimonadetes bacterium]|nr:haloacid dehalogenase type II [Gemmatimonadota bacterium]
MTRPELITFDCYGTLIDWDTGIAQAFAAEGARAGTPLVRDQVLSAYHEVEPEVEAGEYRPYREVLRVTARHVAVRLGLPLAPEREGFLVESLPSWMPFPDTNPALEKLRGGGYRLGILSNVDDDLLAGTLHHFTVKFDVIVTAQRVRSYKPGAAHFERALAAAGGVAERLVHAARSYFHDVRPARRLGIPTVWVNRAGVPGGDVQPTAEVRDLNGLVRWLEGVSAARDRG